MKLLCVNCNIELRVRTNDVTVIRIHTNPPTLWQVWLADLLACPVCGVEIVSGFALKPLAELGTTPDWPAVLARCLQGPEIIRSYESFEDAERLRDKPLEREATT